MGHALKNQKSINYHLHIRTFKKRTYSSQEEKKPSTSLNDDELVYYVARFHCKSILQCMTLNFGYFRLGFFFSLCGFWVWIFIFRYLAIYISLSFINFKWLWLSSAHHYVIPMYICKYLLYCFWLAWNFRQKPRIEPVTNIMETTPCQTYWRQIFTALKHLHRI